MELNKWLEKYKGIHIALSQLETCFHHYLSCFAIIKTKMITSLQIECNGTVRNLLEINSQNFLRHVIVIQLVVTEGHIDIEGKVLPIRGKN